MEGEVVTLGQTWVIGNQLDKGGFGRVFDASCDDQTAVAKFVPKEPGADRELLFVTLPAARNVVPVIDSGEYGDYWVLVMPKADLSLRQHLTQEGPLAIDHAVTVLVDIVSALVDLTGQVVHRDLKPENVLRLEGQWCIADFGISRYASASTAPDTRKYSLTPDYAAPEQWRGERATNAADVYAFGVIAYEMIAGRRPFTAATEHELRDMHLHKQAPALGTAPLALVTLVEECLYKAPDARPTPANVHARLERFRASTTSTPGLTALQAANYTEVERLSIAATEESSAHTAFERRKLLFQAAQASHIRIADALRDAITDAASSATITPHRDGRGWTLSLGKGQLTVTSPVTWETTPWGQSHRVPFEVVAAAEVNVKQPVNRFGYEGRSHSMWFGDIQEKGRYEWYEVAFMYTPFSSRQSNQQPFALTPGHDVALALSHVMSGCQLAWPFTTTRADDLTEFIDRWGQWLAAASSASLTVPSTMPERPTEHSWRRA